MAEDFTPDLTPREMFQAGVFGGTYWRPISGGYQLHHLQYEEWWEGIPEDHLTRAWEDYDPSINKYGVYCGTTLEYWREKGWIRESDPYGWVEWYCRWVSREGERVVDDEDLFQINRWKNVKSRFVGMLRKYPNSAKIKQTLLHWAIDPELYV